MSLFWNKTEDSHYLIYTRTAAQKRLGLSLMLLGLFVFIGLPTLIKNSSSFTEIANRWPVVTIIIIFAGALLIVLVAVFMSEANRQIARARRNKWRVQITSNAEADTVTIFTADDSRSATIF
jgi:hypothetical protein